MPSFRSLIWSSTMLLCFSEDSLVRPFIDLGKQITKTINDFGSIIGQDRKLYTDKQTGKGILFELQFGCLPDDLWVKTVGASEWGSLYQR